VRIQYFSDLHLEFGSVEITRTPADIIVAAGDIGLNGEGLEWLKTLEKKVVYVAGNHEFYGGEHAARLSALRAAAEGSNVLFLEKAVWQTREVRFLGCTLWSDLGGVERDRLDDLVDNLNDFHKIRAGGENLSVSTYIAWYRESRRWLVEELEKPFPGKTVVVTHHAPTPWSWHGNPGHIKRHAYCSDLKEILHSFEIAAWFHGHTHSVSDYVCAGARILCNPRGYYPDHLVAEFDSGRMVEI
jgi:3',5'-cyclic AMP phosphodiesterase CpdA